MWEWLGSLLASDTVSAWLLAGLAAGGAAVARWEFVRRWKLERAAQCLEGGVRQVYEEYVRACKDADPGGKLDDEERSEAMRRALAAAQDFAKQEGVDLLKQYAKEYLPVLVDRFIRRAQTESRLVKWIPRPFGDGSPTDSSASS